MPGFETIDKQELKHLKKFFKMVVVYYLDMVLKN